MPLEIEAKIKVDSHDAVRAKLVALGAQCVGRVLETNHIFDDADRTLLASGSGLRIRTCCVLDGDAPPATITYKGPRQPGPLKNREEIQISLDDAQAGRALLVKLGFVEALRFEKRRETWRLDDCHIELDELPYLGCYVEIEGPEEQAIRRTQQAVDLAERETICETYIALLVEHCRRNNLPADHIVFDNSGR